MWDKSLEVKLEVQSTYAFVILIETAKFLFLYSLVKAVMPNIILCVFIQKYTMKSGLPIKELGRKAGHIYSAIYRVYFHSIIHSTEIVVHPLHAKCF